MTADNNSEAGSATFHRLKQYLEIGQIVGTHGVYGELRVNPWCDTPDFLKSFKTLYYDVNGTQAINILSCRAHGNIALLCIEGVRSVEAAAALRGKVLFMCRKDVRLPKGKYFISDLIGCRIIDADDENKIYGTLTDVSQTGANDVWHIRGTDNKEYLLPAIPPVVINTDIEAGIIKIRPLIGIFDECGD